MARYNSEFDGDNAADKFRGGRRDVDNSVDNMFFRVDSVPIEKSAEFELSGTLDCK